MLKINCGMYYSFHIALCDSEVILLMFLCFRFSDKQTGFCKNELTAKLFQFVEMTKRVQVLYLVNPPWDKVMLWYSYCFCCVCVSTGIRATKSFSRFKRPTFAWAPMLYLPSSSDVLGIKSATKRKIFVWELTARGFQLFWSKSDMKQSTHWGYMTP